MRLIIIGCEYAGKTTLVQQVHAWIERSMGPTIVPYHDHFTFPHITHGEMTDDEHEQVSALSPRLKAMVQNHQILYHLNSAFYADHDNIMVGFHIENAIYGPLYYGYEDDGTPEAIARNVEGHIMEHARDTIMVLVKASAEVIASRMEENPQPVGALRREHIELVLRRFEEEHSRSLIRYKFALDTSTSTPEKTFQEFLTNVQPLLRESDQIRILARRAMEPGG